MQGKRERCFGVGMDDFIGKPLDLGRLHAVLACWVGDD